MTTHATAPTREADRAPEDAMREEVARESYEYIEGVGSWAKCPIGEKFNHRQWTKHILAAAEPHLRARHRAELFAELIDAAEKGGEYYPTGELQIVVSWPYEEGEPLAFWLRDRQQAIADAEGERVMGEVVGTRPDRIEELHQSLDAAGFFVIEAHAGPAAPHLALFADCAVVELETGSYRAIRALKDLLETMPSMPRLVVVDDASPARPALPW